MSKRALLFPGQGSQYVGMAKDLYENTPEAKEMIQMADHIMAAPLSQVMFNGPEDELRQTKYTQPAIFVHSVVLAGLIRTLDFDGAAGHSLGEYSALVAAGAIQYADAVAVVATRGAAMQQAGVENPGTMAAIIGLANELIVEACNDASAEGIVQPANFNSPGQVVISGSVVGVKKAMELCKAKGAKMVKELVVSGAFHSPLMQSAQDKLLAKLEVVPFYSARKPVYANVTAKPVVDPQVIKDLLYKQVTAPVLWEETIKNMVADGFDEFVEVGPGKVLQGLVKRIAPQAVCSGIDTLADVEKYR
ncbi:MAG: ACP S-malonyltransferase [Ignavibacteria bacterium]|nr:ACP S-malonyltransferase [Ignavibacteria bacterium]